MSVLYPLLIAVLILLAPGLRGNPVILGMSMLIFLGLAYGKWVDIRSKQVMANTGHARGMAHSRRASSR